MFRWLKRKRNDAEHTAKDQEQLITAAYRAVSDLGDLMRQYPVSVLDSSMLPLPKPAMKEALKFAWKSQPDPKFRDAIGAAFVSLADFQDGVGPNPINSTITPGDNPQAVLDTLNPWLEWQEKVMAEGAALLAEFQEFERQQVV